MIQYLNNLIPRLKEFSANLDKIEIFIEKPWVIIDDNNNVQKYIFRRNGELIMSLNGQVTVGKWELLSAAKCLLIDRIQNKILLNQDFIDPGIMILKGDGIKGDHLILANEILIPDLNIVNYLKNLYYKNFKITTFQLSDGNLLEIPNYNEFGLILKKVMIEGQSVPDGTIQLKNSKRKFLIQNSQIVKILSDQEFDTNVGKIVVERESSEVPRKGDHVFKDGCPAPNGKYRIGFMESIIVKDGIIINR